MQRAQTRNPRGGLQKTMMKQIKAVPISSVNKVGKVPVLQQPISINGQVVNFEVDTGAGESFVGQSTWQRLGAPELAQPTQQFESASQHPLPVLGSITVSAKKPSVVGGEEQQELEFNVAEQPQLNLLGRNAIQQLDISVDSLLHNDPAKVNTVHVFNDIKPDIQLQEGCKQLCGEFPDVFKPELGQLKDFELEVKFKEKDSPIFCKPRPVPFAIQEDLTEAIQAGVRKGVWVRTHFNEYGTPVVPVRKARLPGESKPKVRVCGDYSCHCESTIGTVPISHALTR